MMLRVDVDGKRVVADVGFGADGLLLPVSLDDGESPQFAWTYRVIVEGNAQVLQSRRGDSWGDLYAFTQEPQLPVDYEIANHYTSTHPASRFMQLLTAQRLSRDARWTLRNRDLLEDRGTTIITRAIRDDDERIAVLADTFGLVFPAKTRFTY